MKNQEQEQARKLYIQTNLSKTEIADKLGVNRKTIYQWSVDGDWEVLRASARCMPSILAQKVYHLIGHFTDHLLQRDVAYQSVSKDDVFILDKLVTMVTKLKAGSTASENMETFSLLLEGLQVKDPFLAAEMQPHFETFVVSKATMAHNSYLMNGYGKDGSKPFPEKDLSEKWQDEHDYDTIVAENQAAQAVQREEPSVQADSTASNTIQGEGAKEHAEKPNPVTANKNNPAHTKFTNSYRSWLKNTKPVNTKQPDAGKSQKAA